jgi:RHS repeat-associated protein
VFIPNLHGDVGLVGSTTAISGTIAYGPYGDKRVATGDGASIPFTFQSDLTDPDTGLVDMGARLFDPGSGRFTSRDSVFGEPKWPITLNQFVYGGDNPVTLDDPTGMCMYDCFGVIYDGTKRGNGGRTVSTNQNYTYYRAGTEDTDAVPVRGTPPAPPAPPPPTTTLVSAQTLALRDRMTAFNTDPT